MGAVLRAHPLWPETEFVLRFWPPPVCPSSTTPRQSFPGARLCRTNTRLDSKGKKVEERVTHKCQMCVCCTGGIPTAERTDQEMTQRDEIKVTERPNSLGVRRMRDGVNK